MGSEVVDHHVWIPAPSDAQRLARESILRWVRTRSMIVLVLLFTGMAVSCLALGLVEMAIFVLFGLVTMYVIAYIRVLRATRRALLPETRWASRFDANSMTITSPVGRATLDYSAMTAVRAKGSIVSISLCNGAIIHTYARLVPPPAVEFLRQRIGTAR